MIGLVFAIAVVAYLDRTNISVAAPRIQSDFGLSNYALGIVFSAFVLGYALAQPLVGRIADRIGAYWAVGFGIVWWCALTALTAAVPAGFAHAFAALVAIRLTLGIGESMIFPASNKFVANWIPARERGLANGIIFAGVGFGAGLAPPLITAIILASSWRYAFFASACVGVVAFFVWIFAAAETPFGHSWVNAAEREHIAAGAPAVDGRAARTTLPWRTILADRDVRLLTLSYFAFGYVAYIFFTWFFIYLSKVRGLDLRTSGIYGTLPFIAMAIASPLGGWISDGLTQKFGKRFGRCVFAAAGMWMTGVFVTLATQVADARIACVVLAGGSGALYLAQSAFWTLSADMGGASAGSLSGVMNMGCQLGGALVAAITPWLAASLGWTGSFLVAAALAVLGGIAWLLIDPERVLEARAPGVEARRPRAVH